MRLRQHPGRRRDRNGTSSTPGGCACVRDLTRDGICDDVDECVGTLDACGICNGPGETTRRLRQHSGRDCDCNGSYDALGVQTAQ